MVNIANPAAAFQWLRLPARGVGLARMEFIINALIKAHPMALIHPERTSAEDQRRIRELTRGHATPADHFVDTLARGIARLATTYPPHPARTEQRREGTEGVRTCATRWAPIPLKTISTQHKTI